MTAPFRTPFKRPLRAPFINRGNRPPVYSKLMVWLKGSNTSNTLKKDIVNGYDFLFQNCPPDYATNALGEAEGNALGEQEWNGLVYAGWGCEYLAPATGEPGNTELVLADTLGVLYTAGTPNVLTTTIMELWANDQGFFKNQTNKGMLFYNQVLTGSELAQVQAWIA